MDRGFETLVKPCINATGYEDKALLQGLTDTSHTTLEGITRAGRVGGV